MCITETHKDATKSRQRVQCSACDTFNWLISCHSAAGPRKSVVVSACAVGATAHKIDKNSGSGKKVRICSRSEKLRGKCGR